MALSSILAKNMAGQRKFTFADVVRHYALHGAFVATIKTVAAVKKDAVNSYLGEMEQLKASNLPNVDKEYLFRQLQSGIDYIKSVSFSKKVQSEIEQDSRTSTDTIIFFPPASFFTNDQKYLAEKYGLTKHSFFREFLINAKTQMPLKEEKDAMRVLSDVSRSINEGKVKLVSERDRMLAKDAVISFEKNYKDKPLLGVVITQKNIPQAGIEPDYARIDKQPSKKTKDKDVIDRRTKLAEQEIARETLEKQKQLQELQKKQDVRLAEIAAKRLEKQAAEKAEKEALEAKEESARDELLNQSVNDAMRTPDYIIAALRAGRERGPKHAPQPAKPAHLVPIMPPPPEFEISPLENQIDQKNDINSLMHSVKETSGRHIDGLHSTPVSEAELERAKSDLGLNLFDNDADNNDLDNAIEPAQDKSLEAAEELSLEKTPSFGHGASGGTGNK